VGGERQPPATTYSCAAGRQLVGPDCAELVSRREALHIEVLARSPVGGRVVSRLGSYHRMPTGSALQLSNGELYELVVEEALAVTSEGMTRNVGRSAADLEGHEDIVEALCDMADEFGWAARWSDRPQAWIGRHRPSPSRRPDPAPPSKPPAVLWTSSVGYGVAVGWLPAVRSGVLGPADDSPVWEISPRPGLRVLEVNRPDDWAALLRNNPGPVVDGFIQPDWERFAAAFDGIHLTVEGLLTAQAVPIAVERGTVLRDFA